GSQNYDQKITLFDSNVDLALIEFTAEKGQTYSVAPLTESLSVGKPVYAFGWKSCSPDSKNFQFTKGAICKVKASLGYGRDMRYTNNIIKGVSGGPIFDSQGRVLAIQSALADETGKQICESMPIEPDDNFSDGIGVSISEHIMPLQSILQNNKSSIELKNDTSLETSN
ncbi:MAG: serine protease, partial [Sphaerospermopsis kisseleviana]